VFIYLIVNHITGKYYVGQHKGPDLQRYLRYKFSDARNYRGSSYLFNSMKKHPLPCDWTIHALLSDVQTKAELDQHERDFIAFLKSQDPEFGYNICRGGEGFTGTFSAESKAKMSASHKGHPTTSETRRKISEAHKENFNQGFVSGKQGWVTPPETRAKQSVSNKGKHDLLKSPEIVAKRIAAWRESLEEHGGSFQTPESIAKIRVAGLGRTASLKTRQRLHETHLGQVPWNKGKHTEQVPWNKGKKMSEEYCKNVGNANRGKEHSAETRLKIRTSHLQRTPSDTQLAIRIEASNHSRHIRWHINRGLINPFCNLCPAS